MSKPLCACWGGWGVSRFGAPHFQKQYNFQQSTGDFVCATHDHFYLFDIFMTLVQPYHCSTSSHWWGLFVYHPCFHLSICLSMHVYIPCDLSEVPESRFIQMGKVMRYYMGVMQVKTYFGSMPKCAKYGNFSFITNAFCP